MCKVNKPAAHRPGEFDVTAERYVVETVGYAGDKSPSILHMVRQSPMCTVVVDPGPDGAEHSSIRLHSPPAVQREVLLWTPH